MGRLRGSDHRAGAGGKMGRERRSSLTWRLNIEHGRARPLGTESLPGLAAYFGGVQYKMKTWRPLIKTN